MLRKRWNIQTADEALVECLRDDLGLSDALVRVLAVRGYSAPESIEKFLHPRLGELEDPFSLPDMRLAVDRIWKAIKSGQRIVVFGDYDVDGVTSSALMIRILRALKADVEGFVPDRLDEGYGLSPDSVDRCLEDLAPALVVTVDCGTNSVPCVADIQARGVDVIVTDHHEPEDTVAGAVALINPKLGCCTCHLSGVGVAFKLAHALVKSGREMQEPAAMQVDLRHYLDLVALGTVADIVPLEGENRILVRNGLLQLAATRWSGLSALLEVASIRGEFNSGHLGFQLGPRINAAGRVGEPMQALRLLTTDDPLEARNIAKLLDRNNRERRDIERKMANEAFEEIDRYYDPTRHFGLVVAREGWHPGVVGIVASRVSRHYNRPAIIMGIDEDGSARGSCRGIEAFDLLAGLQECSVHLSKFGGHRMAAGLEVKAGKVEAFHEAFNATAAAALAEEDLSPVQRIDAVLTGSELDWGFYDALRHLRPFGQNNPEPVWALIGVQAELPQVVGKNHLKMKIRTGEQVFDAIAFNYARESLPAGLIDVAFTLKKNSWHGNETLQLQVADIRPSGA